MLIDLKKLEQDKVAYKSMRHEDKCGKFINEDVRLEIDVQLGKLLAGHSIHYMTETRWHLHDLLVYCIREIGPCSMYMCMYAVKEY